MPQRIFVDANVLVSKTLYDWLFLLRNETDGMFQLHASFDVVVEAVRAWRRINPRARGGAARRRFDHLVRNLDEVLEDFDSDVDFEGDIGDLHVHGAATASGAHKLLTENASDFGDPDMLPYEVYLPDAFFCLVDDGAPSCVRRVTLDQAKYWHDRREKGHLVKKLDQALLDAGCPFFADRITSHLKALS